MPLISFPNDESLTDTPIGKLLNRDRIHAEGDPHRDSPSPCATLPRIACRTVVVYSFRLLPTAGKYLLCVRPARAWPWRRIQNLRRSACAERMCATGSPWSRGQLSGSPRNRGRARRTACPLWTSFAANILKHLAAGCRIRDRPMPSQGFGSNRLQPDGFVPGALLPGLFYQQLRKAFPVTGQEPCGSKNPFLWMAIGKQVERDQPGIAT